MKGPLCSLCGNEHWPREPHQWKNQHVEPIPCAECAAKDATIAKLTAANIALQASVDKLSTVVAKSTFVDTQRQQDAVHSPHESTVAVHESTDSKAYKREWMRQDRSRRKCSS